MQPSEISTEIFQEAFIAFMFGEGRHNANCACYYVQKQGYSEVTCWGLIRMPCNDWCIRFWINSYAFRNLLCYQIFHDLDIQLCTPIWGIRDWLRTHKCVETNLDMPYSVGFWEHIDTILNWQWKHLALFFSFSLFSNHFSV